MGSTLLTPLYLFYQRAFVFSAITLTLVYAVYVDGNLCALFFFGRLSDQIGRQWTSLSAMALADLATVLFLLAGSVSPLFLTRILSGFAIGIASGAATAWIVELVPGYDKQRASTIATKANFIGFGAGPLLAGLLAQYVPGPLQTSRVVYLTLLALIAWPVARLGETVSGSVGQIRGVSFRPRLGVPTAIRKAFLPPAVAAFAIFALLGYYAALMPSLMSEDLTVGNAAVAGAVVAELFLVAAASVVATRDLPSRTAMLSGLFLLLPSLACLLLARIETRPSRRASRCRFDTPYLS